jgi:4'-phosphopantetheinyl transferase
MSQSFNPSCLFENEELTIMGIPFTTPYATTAEDVRNFEKSLVLKLIGSKIHDDFKVVYDTFGKPGIEPGKTKLSISHTKGYVVVALSQTFNPGIDIEYKRPQLQKIGHRVFHTDELRFIQFLPDYQLALQLLWGAKEAIYKSYGGKGLDFIKHIRVQPFDSTYENLTATIITTSFQARYTLKFLQPEPDYFLIFVTGCEQEMLKL